MKKLFVLCLLSIVVSQFALAQQEDLFVKSSSQGLYIDHKIGPKQGMYAIGRLYNVNPKFIAAFNKIDLNAGLSIGQVIRIPLTDTNFIQAGNTGTPVYYRVGNSGENLQKISSATKNVPTQSIKDWNNLKGDIPKSGVKLVVGFLRSNEMPSITIAPPVRNEVTKTEVKEESKKEEPKAIVKDEPKKEEPKAIVKEEPKKEEPKAIVKEEPKKEEPKAIVKEEPKKEESRAVVKDDAIQVSNVSVNYAGGYFRSSFDQQVKLHPVSKNVTATSGIFKTTSGGQDAKYYLLIDNITPGTIVRIVNPDNNNEIYAKVLGEMSGIRQNQGLDIRMSNAAASALQITDQEKFIVKVVY